MTMRSRAILVACGAVFGGSASTASAQVQLSAADVKQIVDIALEVVLPPERRLSRVPVEERRIYFDHAATLTAFGVGPATPLGRPRLLLQRPVEDATPEILEDCLGFSEVRCARLGQGVYVSVSPAPERGAASEVAIWVHVRWTSRSANQPSEERVTGMGFSSELFVARNSSGCWEFLRTGRTAVS